MSIYFLIFFELFSIIACTINIQIESENNHQAKDTTGYLTEFPNYKKSDQVDSLTPHMTRIFSKFSSSLPIEDSLHKIENQIRFWISSDDSLRLIVLERKGLNSTSSLFLIKVSGDSSGNFKSLSYKKIIFNCSFILALYNCNRNWKLNVRTNLGPPCKRYPILALLSSINCYAGQLLLCC